MNYVHTLKDRLLAPAYVTYFDQVRHKQLTLLKFRKKFISSKSIDFYSTQNVTFQTVCYFIAFIYSLIIPTCKCVLVTVTHCVKKRKHQQNFTLALDVGVFLMLKINVSLHNVVHIPHKDMSVFWREFCHLIMNAWIDIDQSGGVFLYIELGTMGKFYQEVE